MSGDGSNLKSRLVELEALEARCRRLDEVVEQFKRDPEYQEGLQLVWLSGVAFAQAIVRSGELLGDDGDGGEEDAGGGDDAGREP